MDEIRSQPPRPAGAGGTETTEAQASIPVVAIGASAGGLEPIGRLLSALPAGTGLAFVVIQHLDPASPSALTALLARRTTLPVETATHATRIAPGHVYVIPPHAYLTLAGPALHLAEPGERKPVMPIDVFLRSLAQERGPRGIGILLSGTGTDGAAGLQALREAGGLTLVQDPQEAGFDGMPRHAMEVAHPDFVLPVAEMPAVLARYASHAYVTAQPAPAPPEGPAAPEPTLADFVDAIKSGTGMDFHLYKTGTLQRRIERRLALHGIASRRDYLAQLRRDPAEAGALARDLLINVTRFFRDPDCFALLGERVAAALRDHLPDRMFRAWVAGCSTGEEAYSLAILLTERMAAAGLRAGIQIFATDIDEDALETARAGIYPDSIRHDLTADRLARFFSPEGGRFRVSMELRRLITFSRHDVLHDPPFSRLDLVCCRNVLIYFVPEAQRQALAAFDFALLKGGLLLLGSAGSVNAAPGLFEPLDEKSRIYRKRVPEAPDEGDPEVTELRRQLTETRRELDRTIAELREANESLKSKNEEAMSLNEEYLSTNEELESSKEELQSLNEELTTLNNQLQKTLEHEQQMSNDLTNLLNSSSVATILLDSDLNIKIFNPPMRALFSLIEADVGRPLADLSPKFADPDLTADARAARSSGASREREIRAASGAWYMRSVMPYRNETGGIRGAVVTFTDVTRLKHEQAATSDAHRLTETVVEMATEPMAAIGEDFRLISANQPFCAAFGIHPDQRGKLSLRDFQSPVLTHPTLLEIVGQFLTGGQNAGSQQVTVTQSQGEQDIWQATVRAFRAPPQEPVVLLALENITGRTHIVRQQLQLLIDALPTPTLATDPQGRIRFVSRQTEALFGYAKAELLGHTIDRLIPPEFRERHRGLHAAFLQTSEPRAMGAGLAILGLAKDGTRLPLDIGLSPVETADGKLVLAAIHDLREFKRGEAERERLRAQLTADLADMQRLHDMATRLAGTADLPAMLDEILSTMIGVQGADFGNIQLYDSKTGTLRIAVQKGFSAPFLAHFGVARTGDGSVCGRALEARTRVVVTDVEQDAAFAPHRAAAAEAGFRAVQSTPIFARDGTIEGMISTHFRNPHTPSERDLRITDLYMRMAAELIERSQAEAALRAARQAADEASRAKSRFLAAASHDLRQPLQTLELLHGVLEQQIVSPQARTTLLQIGPATSRMGELIDSLLDLDQIETGSLKLEITDISVEPLLTRAVAEFAPLASAKGLDLRCVPRPAVIRGDRRLLVRILGNLLSNAIKYTDEGRILVGCRQRGEGLRIEVWDTGIGIPADRISDVFGEFDRVQPADGGKAGLGLGLHIVKRFADLLGYEIDIRSNPGRGTMLALVVRHADFADIPGPAPAGPPAASASPSVLLVEDDDVQRDALRALLELKGYRVTAARTSTDAMARLRRAPADRPHVIVTDFNLPDGIFGTDLVRQVRDELNAEIPALILSGRRPDTALSPAKADDLQFLGKPVKPSRLLAAVESLAQRSLPDWQPWAGDGGQWPQLRSLPRADADIAVIDDDAGVRDATRVALEAHGYRIETFPSAETFLADPGHDRFRCLLVDVSLPGIGGLELQRRLKSEPRQPCIIFLTGTGELPVAVEAMREGAADFLQKPVGSADLAESVARALEKETETIPPQTNQADIAARLATLTHREREILDRIVVGQLNKNIAADLGISERTTEHHRQNVMRKMGVKSLAMLVRSMTGLTTPV